VQTQKRQNELIKVSGISQSDYDQAVLQVNFDKRGYRQYSGKQIRKTEVRARSTA